MHEQLIGCPLVDSSPFSRRPLLVAFEGPDGVGKTTHAASLARRLNGQLLKFPSRTGPVGSVLDSYLRRRYDLTNEAAHLLFSADRWEKQGLIRAHLLRGRDVVLDRYVYSGAAYSLARGLDRKWPGFKGPDATLIRPDLVFLLTSESHCEGGVERHDVRSFQQRVAQEFERMMADNGRRRRWIRISTLESSIKEVEEAIDLGVWLCRRHAEYRRWRKPAP